MSANQTPESPRYARLMQKSIVPLTMLFLAAAVVWSIITPTFLQQQYEHLPPDPHGLTDNQRMELAKTAVTYLMLWSPPDEVINILADQTLADGSRLYAEGELSHLVDVKHLTDAIRVIGLSALSLLMITVITQYRPRRDALKKTAVGGLLLIPTAFFLLVFATLLWPLFFVKFHEMLFADGTWAFDEAAGLVRLFPELFWFRVGQAVLTRMLIAGCITFISSSSLYFILIRIDGRKQEEKNNRLKTSWMINYQHELRWLKMGLIMVIPNALLWYLLGFVASSFRSMPAISLIVGAVTLFAGWLTSTAFDNVHHTAVENYDSIDLSEHMVSFFGLGTTFIGVGFVIFALPYPLLAILAPGLIASGLFILALGSGQLFTEYLARRRFVS